ncbi:MAG: hypothetical protein Q9187_007074 [Circinaria calcarea]
MVDEASLPCEGKLADGVPELPVLEPMVEVTTVDFAPAALDLSVGKIDWFEPAFKVPVDSATAAFDLEVNEAVLLEPKIDAGVWRVTAAFSLEVTEAVLFEPALEAAMFVLALEVALFTPEPEPETALPEAALGAAFPRVILALVEVAVFDTVPAAPVPTGIVVGEGAESPPVKAAGEIVLRTLVVPAGQFGHGRTTMAVLTPATAVFDTEAVRVPVARDEELARGEDLPRLEELPKGEELAETVSAMAPGVMVLTTLVVPAGQFEHGRTTTAVSTPATADFDTETVGAIVDTTSRVPPGQVGQGSVIVAVRF